MKRLSFLLVLLLFIGCQTRTSRVKKLFAENNCNQCHAMSFEASQSVSKNWHEAHFWDPVLVVSGSTMPRYADQFSVFPVSVSAQPIITSSGDPVYPLIPGDDLKKIYSFDPQPLVYLYLSNVSWKNFPPGFKAFSEGKKMKGTPVVWVPPELRAVFSPPVSMSVIVPKESLQVLTDYVESLPHKTAPPWLQMPEPPANSLPPGRPLYETRCASCHGDLGDGNGPASIFLYPKPRDFRSGEFKLKSTLNTPAASDSDIYRTLTHGMPGTAMPSWSFLSPDERWALVEYIKRFAKVSAPSTRDREETIEEPKLPYQALKSRIAQGERLFFTKGKCNDCHGPSAKSLDNLPHGDGQSAPYLVDDWGYPILPADLAGGTLKRGNSADDVYLTITAGMPGTPMPPYQNNLTDAERWDIAVYVSALNKGKYHGH